MAKNYPTRTIHESGITYPPELRIARGDMLGHSVVHKFGHNEAVGTSYEAIAAGGIWRTLQPASATTLRVKAGNTNDTNGGSGAWEIELQGISATGALITETVTLAGTSASTATTQTFIRLIRFFVTKSGTYGTQSAGSHADAIVIENGAGGTDWGTIPLSGLAHGQSQVALYTVPLGYTAYLQNVQIQMEGNKPVDFLFIKRENILDASAPYSPMRVFMELTGMEVPSSIPLNTPIKFDELTDFGAMAKASTTAEVSVDMEIILVEN